MSDSTMPKYTGIIPHLVCDPCADAIEFYKRAFGAEELYRLGVESGKIMHAEIQIDGQLIYLADAFPEFCDSRMDSPKAFGGSSVTLHRHVPDCDAAMDRAAAAGATVIFPAHDAFWGARYGLVTDPFGHTWSFATPIRELSPEEMQKAMDEAFQQMPQQI